MKILAVDTSTRIGSLALMEDEALIAEYTVEVKNMHTARLIPLIDHLMRESGCALQDLDILVAGLGPGSFTGVRIGVGTVKSLCYALGKPVVGICTLDAIAANLMGVNQPVCATLDARRKEVYAALYQPAPRRVSKVLCIGVEGLAEYLTQPSLLVGNGVSTYHKEIADALGDKAICLPPALGLPRASLLCQVALPRIRSGESDDPMALAPLYVRKPEAERQYQTGTLGSKQLIPSPPQAQDPDRTQT